MRTHPTAILRGRLQEQEWSMNHNLQFIGINYMGGGTIQDTAPPTYHFRLMLFSHEDMIDRPNMEELMAFFPAGSKVKVTIELDQEQ